MAELSPAAKAVLDACLDENCNLLPSELSIVAAAMRAVADQVVSSVPPPCADFDEYAQGFLAAHTRYRTALLAIATELENQ